MPDFPPLATLLLLVTTMAASLLILRRSKRLNVSVVRRAFGLSPSAFELNVPTWFLLVTVSLLAAIFMVAIYPSATYDWVKYHCQPVSQVADLCLEMEYVRTSSWLHRWMGLGYYHEEFRQLTTTWIRPSGGQPF